jgi:aryl-alcohol dehydrogenase-like predicted oxidoreductase
VKRNFKERETFLQNQQNSIPHTAEGFATAEATQPVNLKGTFRSRRKRLYPQGPWVSMVGFGSYRIGFSPGLGAPESEKALQLALSKGVNLIDTSSNYGNGQSELLIGKTLAKHFAQKTLERSQIVIVTKSGYVQGNNKELADQLKMQGRPFPEIEEFSSDLAYCIHPTFLEDQIDRSLARLGVQTLDVFLIHNPEYLLKKWESTGQPTLENRERFYDRIKSSFVFLETQVAQGKIKSYGVSSNTLGYPDEDPTAVNLKTLHEVAQSISTNHSFKVVQFPFNWIEILPLVFPVEKGGQHTLEYAAQNGIGVLFNRPLNAMHNDGLIRLSRPAVPEGAVLDDAAKQGLRNWTQLAADLEKLAQKHIDVPGYESVPLSQYVISTLMWMPGASAVLLGMRKERYVLDAEEAASRPTLLKAQSIVGSIYNDLEFYKEDPVHS